MSYDQFDINLVDEVLLHEVELVTNLMVATIETDDPLTQDQIDRLLGVVPQPRVGD
ncbi:MAG: hypothetical protein ABWZ90_15290 [Acidimicrobiales bacterium]